MEYASANSVKSRGYVLQGMLFILALIPFGLINIHIMDFTFSCIAVPLIGVYLWPRNAAVNLSIMAIFLCGLFLDLVSDGPLGVWTMVYLLTVGVLRPDLRRKEIGFYSLWTGFVAWMGIVIVFLMLLHKLYIVGEIQIRPLLLMAVTSSLFFPVIYFTRQFARQFVVDMTDPVNR